jgi:hypothetical protein
MKTLAPSSTQTKNALGNLKIQIAEGAKVTTESGGEIIFKMQITTPFAGGSGTCHPIIQLNLYAGA